MFFGFLTYVLLMCAAEPPESAWRAARPDKVGLWWIEIPAAREGGFGKLYPRHVGLVVVESYDLDNGFPGYHWPVNSRFARVPGPRAAVARPGAGKGGGR
jgi:hypothetical protein